MIESECLFDSIRNGDLKWEENIAGVEFELSRLPLHAPDNPGRSNPDWAAAHKRFHKATRLLSEHLYKTRQILMETVLSQ